MRILLDSCTLLWFEITPARLPSRLLRILSLSETELFLSAAAAWEIAIKWASGRLQLPLPPDEFIHRVRTESMIESLPVFEAAALQTAKLPSFHGDPFDRIQISQAIEHNLILATPDPLIRQYAVRTMWD